MKRFYKIASLLFFLLPILVCSQQINHLGVYDGIRSGAVRAFEKDTLGYMWIGTSQGLNRYSGYQFKNYDKFLTSGVVDIISKNGYRVPVFEVKVAKNVILFDQNQDLLKQENETLSVDGVNGSEIVLGSMTEVSTNGNWPTIFDAKQP